jgi:hypothetical protein
MTIFSRYRFTKVRVDFCVPANGIGCAWVPEAVTATPAIPWFELLQSNYQAFAPVGKTVPTSLVLDRPELNMGFQWLESDETSEGTGAAGYLIWAADAAVSRMVEFEVHLEFMGYAQSGILSHLKPGQVMGMVRASAHPATGKPRVRATAFPSHREVTPDKKKDDEEKPVIVQAGRKPSSVFGYF